MSASSALASRLNSNCHPGLPNPVQRVPFGQESRSREAVGLTESHLQVVVAIVAADFTQVGPVCADEIDRVIDATPHGVLAELEQSGWIQTVGHLPKKTTKVYAATAKAWRELGLVGWSLLKETA